MTRPAPSAVAPLLRARLRDLAPTLGLDAATLELEYVLNWGGFVNQSYRVRDGRGGRVHVKLACDEEQVAGLRRWWALREPLEARYHAPRMLAWIDLPEAGVTGPVFAHVDGTSPEPLPAPVVAEVLAVARALHADQSLREVLARAFPTTWSCADAYRATLGGRHAENLTSFREEGRPPFVTDERLAWMESEARYLDDRVGESAAFAERADAPVHADLWAQNVLVAPDGRWHVLDWDDLRLGDPAMDVAMLLAAGRDTWPLPDARSPAPLALPSMGSASLDERVALHTRSILLDWLVDGLADWLDADAVPERAAYVRDVKRRVHEQAYAAYRARYG